MIPVYANGEFVGTVDAEVYAGECKHPRAETTGETCSTGCCDEYACPDCGKKWMLELPD